jgi:Tol biopolymer transport system component
VIDKPIGHYQIVARIGAGGMGEVYRARDTRLNRDVAIKVLPEALAAESDRLRRFDREAESLAALHHPNIAIVHTVVDRAIIMEFVDGEDLSARIARGPIPWDVALPIAGQVVDALAAAHEAGIIHRDLKPANIKVTAAGVVKVLDFGLAKAVGPAGPDAALAGTVADADNSPTLTATAMMSGTVAYMSPEQARGKVVDKRADVWAFGCVLFEMLTGTRAFGGDDAADTLALVLTKDPAWDQLPPGTPGRVRELLRRCLIKNPHLRLRDISHARLEINDAIAGTPMPVPDIPAAVPALAHAPLHPSAPAPAPTPVLAPTPALTPGTTPAPTPGLTSASIFGLSSAPVAVPDPAVSAGPEPGPAYVPERSKSGPILLTAGALIGGVLIGGAAVWQFAHPSVAPVVAAVVHAALPVAPADELNSGRAYAGIGGARTAIAWSPDGRTLAFIGRQGTGQANIYLRDIGADTARLLDGTDGAESLVFSPDGRELAFVAGGAIRRTPVAGGPVTKIQDVRWVNGMSWSASRFVFGEASALMQVALDSGKAEQLTQPGAQERHTSPYLLPGDRAVMFTQHVKRWTSGDERVMIQRLPDGKPTLLQADAADARLLPNGQIAFLRQGTLFVADFDAEALAIRGSPRAVTKDVAQVVMSGISQDLTLMGQFAVSATGALAYVASPMVTRPDAELVAVDRTGKATPLSGQPDTYQAGGSFSPDGGRVAVSLTTNQERRPYAFDLARRTLTPLSQPGKGEFVGRAWSKSNAVAFLVFEASATQLVVINADNPSEVVRVPDSDDFWPSAWSPDGTRLVGLRGGDIWVYSPGATPQLQALQTTPAIETHPSWSPDGKWLAYASNTTGRPEVYIRPYPGPGRDIPISTTGGTAASWSRDGRELFFAVIGADPEVMMVVSMANPAKPGKPARLFTANGALRFSCNPVNCYAVGTGARQFVTTREVTQPARPVKQIDLILNWLETVAK